MNTNLIDLLKQKVSAIVLEGETEYLSEKSQALSSFFPILLSLFKSKPELVKNLQSQLNPRLTDIFATHPDLKQEFLEQVSGTVPTGAIESTLNRSISPTLGFLEAEAGSSEPSAIAHLIERHWSAVSSALPHWATALLSALGVGIASGRTLHQVPEAEPYRAVEEKKKSKFLLSLIAFIILAALLALMFKACSDKKQTEPASGVPAQTATSEPAKLQLSTGSTGDLTTCQLYSGNVSYIDILQKEIKQIFNHNNGCGVETNASYHTEFIDQDAIPSVLKLVKGVPNASLTWMGDQLSIQTANPADAEQLAAKIRPLVKNMTVMTQATSAASAPADRTTAISTGNTNAEKALAEINPENIRALDIATALNMQIINFDTGSSNIPDANKSILDQAAALIKRASHVQLTVKGHTDAVGNASANKALSQKRAQAVVDYLVKQGVDPAQLQAVGYGSEQPVADNATPEGQFKNRRIEFEVLNTDTGVVRDVDEQGVKKQ
ncbi:OmpA family protein [Acinetobacter sp. ANC 5378]|uniref:OmpA family protein n=1 Tax=Acinetobacter sp. ANC 5378 TaxID=2731249 RepID=UPI00148F4F7A|nr:OmpA family protein [Acinetobacter sp. ANC 5378]NNG83036.1 OmpA family protein [Acinetobacter sp. ANC 5378]